MPDDAARVTGRLQKFIWPGYNGSPPCPIELFDGLWKERVEMNKWEYKIINIRSENYRLDPNSATQLNQLGEEGWELVSITSVNFKTGATDNIAMVFKRPVTG
jgi:hypothetical protein